MYVFDESAVSLSVTTARVNLSNQTLYQMCLASETELSIFTKDALCLRDKKNYKVKKEAGDWHKNINC